MSFTIFGKDRKPFECPPAPAYFNRQQVRAYERGFGFYVGFHQDGALGQTTGADVARQVYQKRGMQQALMMGWDAAKQRDDTEPRPVTTG